jgi:hypothetical protein
VFDKTERKFFAGKDVDATMRVIRQALVPAAIDLQQVSSTQWRGRGTIPVYGLVPVVTVFAAPTPQGYYLDLRISADIEGSGIAIAIILWFVFFPITIVLGYLAYSDYTLRQNQLFQAIWTPIQHTFVEPNFAPAFSPPQDGFPPSS